MIALAEAQQQPIRGAGGSVLAPTVTVGDTAVTLTGSQFALDWVRLLPVLHVADHQWYQGLWFWYDKDSVVDDPHDSYTFFVVSDGKIVAEDVSFSDFRDSGFDPSAFEPESEDDRWDHDWARREAFVAYWLGRFFTETDTGQQFVRRPDKPHLHHFGKGGQDARIIARLERVEQQMMGIRQQLWYLVTVAVIALAVLYFAGR